jgi:DNA-binding NarL/FixJ family response regulator
MGLRAMLEQTRTFEVCGEAGSTTEALRLLATEQPDLTLLGHARPALRRQNSGYRRLTHRLPNPNFA